MDRAIAASPPIRRLIMIMIVIGFCWPLQGRPHGTDIITELVLPASGNHGPPAGQGETEFREIFVSKSLKISHKYALAGRHRQAKQ